MAEQHSSETKLSKVEIIKKNSRHLRGTIEEALQDGSSHFSEENVQVLKFHGMYQQDDRDLRAEAKRLGRERYYSMMIRARIPGGRLNASQYLEFDNIADTYGNGTLRITTRQTFQVHGILKENVKSTLQHLHQVLITTLGGCGDQVRNIICCGNPLENGFRKQIHSDLHKMVSQFSAKTNAYHEIWLDGERWKSEEDLPEEEPLYGEIYLPRKFKIGFTVEGDNCVDIYANDLGIVAHPDPAEEKVEGYTLLVGGGMGRTASIPDTYPRLATPLCFVTPEELAQVSMEIVKIQRDFGNRNDRRYSRFKYLLDERGISWFQEELENRVGYRLASPRQLVWLSGSDHLGWHSLKDDQWYLGLFVRNGRIMDTHDMRLKSVLKELLETYEFDIQLTSQQNLLLVGIHSQQRDEVEKKLRNAGVHLPVDYSQAVLHSMACPALPTCGLATAESERVFPEVMERMEKLLAETGLSEISLPIAIRMTGCPNGCARPYIADIAFVGRTPGKYDIFLGGGILGNQLNMRVLELVPIEKLDEVLRPVLQDYAETAATHETFGAYCHRVGLDGLRAKMEAAVIG
ncbi:NADPH-dependent assimilatory sulfite reductase hemoprotein subunit [Alicyclobacillus tolerans]|uniref:Sulfite reductase (NADPH) beta subunit n=1 Tax=Alicyclobacillus tolerans TaxID=90970 RepID=A0A1M6LZJ0_9BACL|nr:NADPH-dependent assimilatory sulfite reductase hemoprotein subunit [Alicyclobacillus montanus]SHJ76594.1 sulfite reductase (NADPH) beta subunit [Alicyclobacillus montanus]